MSKVFTAWSYKPTQDEREVAWLVAKRRRTLNNGGSNLKVETMEHEERLLQQFYSTMAEIAASRMLNVSWSGCGKGSTGIYDIGDGIEVRSVMDAKKNMIVKETDRDDGPCMLVYVDTATFDCHARGWEMVGEAKKCGKPLDAGAKPSWLVMQSELRPMEELRRWIRETL